MFSLRAVTITIEHAGWGVLHRCLQPYSLLVTSKHYIHSELYSTVAIKSGHVTARKVIMTVDVAGLRGRGETLNLFCLVLKDLQM